MSKRTVLITGGAGFIGCNAASHFYNSNWRVVIFDNLSRAGAGANLAWLRHISRFELVKADIRNYDSVCCAVTKYHPEVIIHLAGQVAVTRSIADPMLDFETNAGGMLNVLEAVRHHSPGCFLINASTNKVYGRMPELELENQENRFTFRDLEGIDEFQPLAFNSPYGCSKGAADQYCQDYARVYGLRTVNLRQSCVYGVRQFGLEDQGWVAWFTMAYVLNRPLTIFGNGKQVRDLLYIDDLVACFAQCVKYRNDISGQSINIGGGRDNSVSLLELIQILADRTGNTPRIDWQEWRPCDQPIFVCDLNKASQLLQWKPAIDIKTGLNRMIGWVSENAEHL